MATIIPLTVRPEGLTCEECGCEWFRLHVENGETHIALRMDMSIRAYTGEPICSDCGRSALA